MTPSLYFTEDCADLDYFGRNLGDFPSLYPYQALTHYFNNRLFKSMTPQKKLATKTDHSY